MNIVDKQWVTDNTDELLASLQQGDIIIYPTDTIYGIGCDALSVRSVEALRDLKHRPNKPFSLIAPSKQWIADHFYISPSGLELLPGPVTLILTPKDPALFPTALHPHTDTIGVRIPDHWFSEVVTKLNRPCITTSVNISDQPHMVSVDDIPSSFHDRVAFCIYQGPIHGQSSKKIDLSDQTLHDVIE